MLFMQMSRSVVYVWAVVLTGTAIVAHAAADLLAQPVSTTWLVLLGLTIVAGLATLRIPSIPISFSISDTFTIIAALVVGPSAGAIIAAIDGLVLSCRMESTRRSLHRVLFNMATLAIATWVAATVYFWLVGPSQPVLDTPLSAIRLLLALTIFGVLAFGVNSGMVALAISLEKHAPISRIWKQHLSSLWITYLGGVFAAMLMMFLPRDNAVAFLVLLAPLPVILYVTSRHARGRAEDQIDHLGKMNRVYVAAIEALAQAIDAKDQVTSDHIHRVQDNSIRLARKLHVADELQIQALKAASLLHDVGKIAVPEHILNKPGRLSASEFEIMKRHAPVGADILSVIGFPYPVEPIVRHHHENWDGTGYPDGLAGEAIPIGARILQVVDCFDALTSHRPYRPRMDDGEALKILSDRRGTMYDARVVDAFFELHADHSSDGLVRTQEEPAVKEPTAAPAALGGSDVAVDAVTDQHLELFFDLGRAVAATSGSLQDIGEVLWRQLAPHTPASAMALYRYDEGLDALVPSYLGGEPTLAAGSRIRLGDRLSGWVAATRTAVLNSDARLDVDPELREATTLRSALAVPVSNDARFVGVLTLYTAQSGSFTERHKRLVEAAALVTARAAAPSGAPFLVGR